MFESIKSMSAEKEEECEECGHKGILVNAVIDGEIKRICHRCSITNPVILIKKPSNIRIEDIPRRSVHEILEDMSGIKPTPIEKPTSQVTLEDLRKRYEEVKEKRRQKQIEKERQEAEIEKERIEQEDKVLDEKEFIQHLEKEEKDREIKTDKDFPKESKEIDFNIQTAKHTRIRDLLEKMKRQEQPTPEPEPVPQPSPEPLRKPETPKEPEQVDEEKI